MKYYLDLGVIKTRKTFRKYFDTEFERDKFANRIKYSSKLVVIEKGVD